MTKATNQESDYPRYSVNWALAKRGQLKVYEEKLTCGSWIFQKVRINHMIVYETKSLMMKVRILQFNYEGETYQFGFNPWCDPTKHMNMPFEVKKVKMQYSLISVVVRLLLVAIWVVLMMLLRS